MPKSPAAICRPKSRLTRHRTPVPVTREQLQHDASRAALTKAWPADQLADLVVAPDGHTYIHKEVRRYAKRTGRLPGLPSDAAVAKADIDTFLIPDRFMRGQLASPTNDTVEDAVTFDEMKEPVIASDGHTYDLSTVQKLHESAHHKALRAIQDVDTSRLSPAQFQQLLLRAGGIPTSPYTRQPLTDIVYRHRAAGAVVADAKGMVVARHDLTEQGFAQDQAQARQLVRMDSLNPDVMARGSGLLGTFVGGTMGLIGGALLTAVTGGLALPVVLGVGAATGALGGRQLMNPNSTAHSIAHRLRHGRSSSDYVSHVARELRTSRLRSTQ